MKHHLSIAQRLWLPTLALAVMLIVMGTLSYWRTTSLLALSDAQMIDQQDKLERSLRWAGLTEANSVRVIAGIISTDDSLTAALKPELDAATLRISEYQKAIEAAAIDDDEKASLTGIAKARKAYVTAREKALELRSKGQTDAARALLANEVKPAVAVYLDAQRGFVKMQETRSALLREKVGQDRMRTIWGTLGVMGLIVAGMALGTAALVRSIRTPLAQLVSVASRIGHGDLTVKVDTSRQDEIGQVSQSLADMRDALSQIVSQVRASTESIQVASAEVASGNTDLSQRTEAAAANLQSTASSIEHLSGSVKHSADSATHANELSNAASSVATRGGEMVSRVVTTMDEIHAASRKIADIIGTIDGIAFQTNILALNAAVEAARAGEQGRGFAVVASEVRSLAQRSADASRQIRGLIGSSVERVETGARLVQDAGATMTEIVSSVRRVTDIIAEISNDTNHQRDGIGKVNSAVSQLDQMTQQNAALVEQSAAAAESLRDQAQRLSGVVATFQITGR